MFLKLPVDIKALADLLSPAETEVWLSGVELSPWQVGNTPEPHSAITATHRQQSQQTVRLTGAPLQASEVTVLMTQSKLKLWLASILGGNSPELN